MNEQQLVGIETPLPPAKRQRGMRYAAMAAVLTVLAGAVWYFFFKPKPAPPPAAPSFTVQVTRAAVRPVPVVLQSVGRVVASASVEVRPQVSGVLRQVFIQDGQRVTAGQKLFALDAQPLSATLAQAQAQWARDKALANDAAATQARLKPLADKEFVTAKEYESAVSNRQALEATAAATRTQIEQARIALGYATLTAPISGRAGAVLVKPGSLVSTGGTTPMLVINALSPVEVAFSLPQAELQALRDAMASATLAVEARDSLTQQLRAVGELVFIDNALSEAAGTIGVKARFANTDEKLWPGEFYAVRITLRTENAVTVPERALQQGQNGPYVYVVEGGKAVLRLVKVARVLDGTVAVASGLTEGETVLINLPNNLRDGSAVKVAPPAGAASAARGAASAPASAEGAAPEAGASAPASAPARRASR